MNYFERNRTWNAKWVWAKKEPKESNSFYYFRSEFEYSGEKTVLYITAESRYRLYINGQYAGYGSLQSNIGCKFFDEIDITDYLKKGKNCIGVIANYVGNIPCTRGGFLAEVVSVAGQEVLCATGRDFKLLRGTSYLRDTAYWRMAFYNPYQEQFDFRKEPVKWNVASFDDSGWEQPEILSTIINNTPPSVEPWVFMKRRELPIFPEKISYAANIHEIGETICYSNRYRGNDLSPMLSLPLMQKHHTVIQNAKSLLRDEGICEMGGSTQHLVDRYFDGLYAPGVILDMGEVTVGFLEIDFECDENAEITIGYSERLINGHFANSIENPFADKVTARSGRQTYRPFTWKAFRYVKILVTNAVTPVKIYSVRIISSMYPLEEHNNFRSNDPKLNRLYEICAKTVRLCCGECIVDTPWREQGQFLGDVSFVTLPALYACFGEVDLPAKYLYQCGKAQNETGFIPAVTNTNDSYVLTDYTLHWVNAVYDHYEYTGDTDILHWSYPIILKLMQAFLHYCDDDGLLNNVPNIFIDWVTLEKRGKNSTLNALFYHTLLNVYKICELRNDSFYAELFLSSAEMLKKSFHNCFFDRSKGLYSDAYYDGRLSNSVSEHANTAAILWDLCPSTYYDSILDKLYESDNTSYTQAQPFFTSVVLQALAKAGRTETAIRIVRERWVKRMVDKNASSVYEEWTTNGSWRSNDIFVPIMRTESHAWSAFPAVFLTKCLAGVEVLSAGCKRLHIAPYAAEFDYSVRFEVFGGGYVEIVCKSGKTLITNHSHAKINIKGVGLS